MYIIMVRAREGTESCMHIFLYRFHLEYRYVTRQQAVELVCQLLSVQRALYFEVSNHLSGMYSRIRSSGTYHRYFLSEYG